jgi:hypothetical protein
MIDPARRAYYKRKDKEYSDTTLLYAIGAGCLAVFLLAAYKLIWGGE